MEKVEFVHDLEKSRIIIVIWAFPTHVYTIKKGWLKLGRNVLMFSSNPKEVKEIISSLTQQIWLGFPQDLELKGEVKLKYTLAAPINLGSVVRKKTEGVEQVVWEKPFATYKPNWDADNYMSIWTKIINDVLVRKKVIADDTIAYIRSYSVHYQEVSNFHERFIMVELEY